MTLQFLFFSTLRINSSDVYELLSSKALWSFQSRLHSRNMEGAILIFLKVIKYYYTKTSAILPNIKCCFHL